MRRTSRTASRRRRDDDSPSRWLAFYEVVSRIPEGKVATYGQVAELAGYRGHARQVGYALAATPEDVDIPWHRVINAQGRVSPRTSTKFHEMQEELLQEEGIQLVGGRVDLSRYRWCPEDDDPPMGG